MMISYTNLQCFWIVFILWFVNIRYNAQILRLPEGEVCHKDNQSSSNSICKNINDCPAVIKQMKQNNHSVKICTFLEKTPVVCCPPTSEPTDTYSATEMCTQYSELIYRKIKNPVLISNADEYIKIDDCYQDFTLISNGTVAQPKEFPHMALLSYDEIPNYESIARCGGSLISKNFVLTAAHCEKLGNGDSSKYATWARLGDPLDIDEATEKPRLRDYKIVERIIHPNYKPDSHYHDIALFRLEKDVVFSPYVRPICLNTEVLLNPPTVILTGWGKTGDNSFPSDRLLNVRVNLISAKECNKIFNDAQTTGGKLKQGIVDELMVCSGVQDEKDTCQGDSGGPNQIVHDKYKCMYKQIGITSFGEGSCGNNDSGSVYTRVSNYISWIEKIVWPKMS